MQIIAVVVGILLALFINDWVTQRQQQANVDEAMRAMRAELSANRVEVRSHVRYLLRMAKAMQDSPSNRNKPARPCFEWDRWTGTGGVNITDAAYQTAIATQALANMPFRQAQMVAQVYSWQHYSQSEVQLDMGLLTQHPQPLEFCVDLLDDIGSIDLQLDAAYAHLIGPDKAPLPKPPPPSGTQSPASPSGKSP
ncbi:MAG: hypothetical protein EPN36_01235 [Rhodanobacteraceae bacterium]|nr:MAG: hypothetical protein EPN36_01235 [Rhodanobacteraceae bacterium]